MIIRKLRADDLEQLLKLYQHLHSEDVALPQTDIVQDIWNDILANSGYHYFGGFVGNNLVSSCVLVIIQNLTRGCSPYGLIENVVTHTEHRGRGYGKAILARALEVAWSRSCYKVMLLTGRKDPATLKFYESAGFDGYDKRGFIAKPTSL